MSPEDIEFIAENTLIEIICKFSSPKIELITGTVGPFRAGLTALVPLWLAMNIKQKKMCTIVPPSWLNVTELEEYKERETQSKTFTKMPSEHYMEIAKILLSHAADDIPQAEEIRTIVKDIWDMRMAKIRHSANHLIKEGKPFALLDHFTRFEINSMIPLVPNSLTQLMRLQMSNKALQNTRSSFSFS